MTAALAPRRSPALPTPTPRRAPVPRPELKVLDQAAIRRRARRRNALLAAFVMVLAGFFAVAIVHAKLVASQHELDVTRAHINDLQAEKARVERAIAESSAPAHIVDRATQLGMVRAEAPVFLVAVRDFGDG